MEICFIMTRTCYYDNDDDEDDVTSLRTGYDLFLIFPAPSTVIGT